MNVSSYPVTATSLGTRRPASGDCQTSPRLRPACSLTAAIAVNRPSTAEQARSAAVARILGEVGLGDHDLRLQPMLRHRRAVPGDALLGDEPPRPGQVGDCPSARRPPGSRPPVACRGGRRCGPRRPADRRRPRRRPPPARSPRSSTKVFSVRDRTRRPAWPLPRRSLSVPIAPTVDSPDRRWARDGTTALISSVLRPPRPRTPDRPARPPRPATGSRRSATTTADGLGPDSGTQRLHQVHPVAELVGRLPNPGDACPHAPSARPASPARPATSTTRPVWRRPGSWADVRSSRRVPVSMGLPGASPAVPGVRSPRPSPGRYVAQNEVGAAAEDYPAVRRGLGEELLDLHLEATVVL